MKTKSLSVISISIIFTLLTGCESLNNSLAEFNESLQTASGSSSSSRSRNIPEQVKQATAAAFTKASSRDLQALVDDANPAIQNIVNIISCDTDAYRIMKQYTDPNSDSFQPYSSPIKHMNYHKSGCVMASRIDAWEKLAANAFRFRVVYVSPQSEESIQRNYRAIKQPDGKWLFGF